MAIRAVCKQAQRVVGANRFHAQLTNLDSLKSLTEFRNASAGAASGRLYSSSFSSSAVSPFLRYGCRYIDAKRISQEAKPKNNRLFLVDTLALVRRLEAEGVPSKQAEAITAAVIQVLNDSLENVSHSFVPNSAMQKFEMTQEANLSKFRSETESKQENRFSILQQESERVMGDIKKMRSELENRFSILQQESEKVKGDIEKMRSELRYEIDKVTAGQRLDLNLERGRIRDELANQNAVTSNLSNTLDREIHALKAQLEAAKYDVIKYCIGTLVSISAVGLAVLRLFM